jgi:hypothetical protein
MSAVEATTTTPAPVVVEEVKPTETAAEAPAPAAEAPKVEDVAAPVRFPCRFLCLISFSLNSPFFFSLHKEAKKAEATVGFFFCPCCFSAQACNFPPPLLTGKRCPRCKHRTCL